MTKLAELDPEVGQRRLAVAERRNVLGSWWRKGSADGFIGVLIALCVWELATQTGLLPSQYLPPVTTIAVELYEILTDPSLWVAIGWTLWGWALGLVIATLVAVPLGIFVGLSVFSYASLKPIIETLRSIPSVAWIPVIVLISGVNLNSVVYLAIYAAFWPLFIQAIYGVQDVNPVARSTANVFKLGRVSTFWHVILPSTTPYIATGIRIASTISLLVVVATSMVIGAPGLGMLISLAQSGGALPKMYALLFVMGVLALGLNYVILMVERKLLHWHSSQHTRKGISP